MERRKEGLVIGLSDANVRCYATRWFLFASVGRTIDPVVTTISTRAMPID